MAEGLKAQERKRAAAVKDEASFDMRRSLRGCQESGLLYAEIDYRSIRKCVLEKTRGILRLRPSKSGWAFAQDDSFGARNDSAASALAFRKEARN